MIEVKLLLQVGCHCVKSNQTRATDFDTGEAAEARRVGVLVKAGKRGEHFIGNWS